MTDESMATLNHLSERPVRDEVKLLIYQRCPRAAHGQQKWFEKVRSVSKLCSRTYEIDVEITTMRSNKSTEPVCTIFRNDGRPYQLRCVRRDVKLHH